MGCPQGHKRVGHDQSDLAQAPTIRFCLPTQSGVIGNGPWFLLLLRYIEVTLLFILEPYSHLQHVEVKVIKVISDMHKILSNNILGTDRIFLPSLL